MGWGEGKGRLRPFPLLSWRGAGEAEPPRLQTCEDPCGRALGGMQVIHKTALTAQEYANNEGHREVRPEELCPCCRKRAAQHRHGTYLRNVVGSAGKVVRIAVARFRCAGCRGASSYLPSFALTYRLCGPGMLEGFLLGLHDRADVQRWLELLARYARRMTEFASILITQVGWGLEHAPPAAGGACARDVVGWLRKACGNLEIATGVLVDSLGLGILRAYKCHQK